VAERHHCLPSLALSASVATPSPPQSNPFLYIWLKEVPLPMLPRLPGFSTRQLITASLTNNNRIQWEPESSGIERQLKQLSSVINVVSLVTSFTSNLLNYLLSEMGLFALNNCSWFMFIGPFKIILRVLFQSFGYHCRKIYKNGIYVLDNVVTVQFVMWCLFLKVYRHISSQSLSESYLELLLRFCDLNASCIFILQSKIKW